MADLLNPEVIPQLGLDPASISPPQGLVLIAFNNTTQLPADFFAFSAASAVDQSKGARNFSVRVEARSVRNEVIECPVGLISPGSLGANFQIDQTAALVIGAAGGRGGAVAYGGPPLVAGTAFTCGDVIEIRLAPTGGAGEQQEGQQQGYVITVRRIP